MGFNLRPKRPRATGLGSNFAACGLALITRHERKNSVLTESLKAVPTIAQSKIKPMRARKQAARHVIDAAPLESVIRLAEQPRPVPQSRRKAAARRADSTVVAHRLAAEFVARYCPGVSKHRAACLLAAALSGGPAPPGAAAMVAACQMARQKAGLSAAPSASQLRRDLIRIETQVNSVDFA